MPNENSKKLNIEEWRELAKLGANINMKIEPTGVSMRPLIRGGLDTVIVEPLSREPMKGDIVLFLRADGARVLHRVWKIEGDKVTTFGDGCWYPDKSIGKKDVLGIATILYRKKRGAKPAKIENQKNSKMNEEGDLEKNHKKINLDTKMRRKTGLLWVNAAPLRRAYYRVRNIAHALKRRLRKH